MARLLQSSPQELTHDIRHGAVFVIRYACDRFVEHGLNADGGQLEAFARGVWHVNGEMGIGFGIGVSHWPWFERRPVLG